METLGDLPLLIVDDDAASLRALERTLTARPWKVVACEDSRKAAQLIDEQEFAAVISDFRMPGMDGVQLLSKVRARWPHTERVLLTAAADEESLERSINEAGVSRLLHKPWRPEALLQVLDQIIEQSRLRREYAVLVEQVRQRNEELRYLNELLSNRVAESDRSLVRFRRRWDVALNAISDPIIIVAEDLRVEGANAAAGELAQSAPEALEGRKCHEVLFDGRVQCKGCPIGSGAGRVTKNAAHGERLFDARAYALPGTPAYLCVYQDVTQAVAFAQEAAHMEKMAAMGRLASGVAHELNNPLHAILSFAQLAQKPDVQSGKLDRYLEVIRESAMRCRDIVQTMRTFARRDAGSERAPVDLHALCDRAIELFAVVQGKVIERVPANFSAATLANANQLQQVLVNLVQNAIDASPDKGLVRIAVEDGGGDWVIAIEDQGAGVPEAERDKIFEPFYTTKPEGVGTGLGLAISHHIMSSHGGSIRVGSSSLGGARFEARLPKRGERRGDRDE